MMSFLKTFGKGILYFIGLPFLIVFLFLYGFYLFVIFLIYFVKMVVLFFKGKKFSLKDEMDQKAYLILKQRKAEAISRQVNPAPTTINNNFTSINVSPELLTKPTFKVEEEKQIPNNIKEIDLSNNSEDNNL